MEPLKIEFEEIEIAKLSDDCEGDLAIFDCSGDWQPTNDAEQVLKEGEIDINDFIKHDALKQQKMGLSNTYLFYYEGVVISFVTIMADSIKLSSREKQNAELPYKEVPAIKIGRLGTDYKVRGYGVGCFVIDFIKALAFNLTQGKDVFGNDIGTSIGVRYVTLDSYFNNLQYYEKRGFGKNLSGEYDRRNTISMRYDLH
jgi:hypothetical protein